jgi:hypothetical protein
MTAAWYEAHISGIAVSSSESDNFSIRYRRLVFNPEKLNRCSFLAQWLLGIVSAGIAALSATFNFGPPGYGTPRASLLYQGFARGIIDGLGQYFECTACLFQTAGYSRQIQSTPMRQGILNARYKFAGILLACKSMNGEKA